MCEAERQAEAVVRGCANPSSPGDVLFAPMGVILVLRLLLEGTARSASLNPHHPRNEDDAQSRVVWPQGGWLYHNIQIW
jgi:hypothetical protein